MAFSAGHLLPHMQLIEFLTRSRKMALHLKLICKFKIRANIFAKMLKLTLACLACLVVWICLVPLAHFGRFWRIRRRACRATEFANIFFSSNALVMFPMPSSTAVTIPAKARRAVSLIRCR